MNINFNYEEEIQPVYQKAFNKKWNFLKSGRLAGKTRATVKYLVMNALMKNVSVLVLRNFNKTNKDSTYAEIINYLMEKDLLQFCKVVTSPNPQIRLPNRSVFYFGGLDKPDSYKGMIGLNSNPISLVWFEEASEMWKKKSWDEALEDLGDIRQTYIRNASVKFIFTFNSNIVNNYLHQKEKLGFSDDEQLIHTSVYDNIYASQEAIDELEAFKEIWPEYYRMIVYGEYMNLADKVYLPIPELGELPEYFDKLMVGIDIGYNDDTAFSLIGKRGETYYHLEEMSFNEMDFYEIESKLMNFLNNQVGKYKSIDRTRIIVETATGGKMFIKTLKRIIGDEYRILAANKKYRLEEGILALNRLLSYGNFRINHNTVTYKQFNNLTYDDNNKPEDGNDHLHDASKYAMSYDIYKVRR